MSGKRPRRPPSAEERALFEDTLKDSVPLKKAPRPRTAPSVAAAACAKLLPKPSQEREKASPLQRSAAPTGIDGNTARRLQRGERAPEARLDLHGLTLKAAHRALTNFLLAARERDLRLVLVVTGKGGSRGGGESFDGAPGRPRGILHAMTPRWLAESGLAAFVADVRPAHGRHGGAGALYVYLRKR